MNQILFFKNDDEENEVKREIYQYKYIKKTTTFTIPLFIIVLIMIVIGSLSMFVLASNEMDKKIQVEETNNQQEYEISVDNTIAKNFIMISEGIEENVIEVNETTEEQIAQEETIKEEKLEENQQNTIQKQDTYKKDSSALAQINTKTRKTSSGTKYTSIGLIRIPSLNIKYQILSKTTDDLLKISVCKFWGPNPNEVGNLCIVGHNYKTSKFFGNLPKIKKGTKVYITDLYGKTLKYKVYETDIIKETDLNCTSQRTNGKTEITLITCYYLKGYTHATRRFIAKARAVE